MISFDASCFNEEGNSHSNSLTISISLSLSLSLSLSFSVFFYLVSNTLMYIIYYRLRHSFSNNMLLGLMHLNSSPSHLLFDNLYDIHSHLCEWCLIFGRGSILCLPVNQLCFQSLYLVKRFNMYLSLKFSIAWMTDINL